ncbi:hypothetical protein [Plantactinospora sp. B5E13]|uniref:hypothetical protein n=1 Tax=Plantactinospora sp. B5E13 TaxID=3153758 RepID=UPI00325EE9EB
MGTPVLRNAAAFTNPGEHIPRRPTWACRICETDWPCDSARATLRVEYRHDPLALFVYLGLCLHEATEDLYKLNPNPGPDPVELHARFIGWVPVDRMIRRALLLRGYADPVRTFPPSRSPDQRGGNSSP